jgi:hypothetical protein
MLFSIFAGFDVCHYLYFVYIYYAFDDSLMCYACKCIHEVSNFTYSRVTFQYKTNWLPKVYSILITVPRTQELFLKTCLASSSDFLYR